MKNTLFIRRLCLGILLLCVFGNKNSFASHIVGMDLKYSHVLGNTYNIICVAYGDCGIASSSVFPTLYTSTPKINIYDGNSYVTCITLHITPPDSGENIAKYVMCASDTNNTTCTNTSNPYPGIKKFVYTGQYTLPNASHYWRFIFSGDLVASSAGRAAAITNIAGGTTTQLEDTLDNMVGANSNANLSLEPILFFCLNNSDSYNPVAVDPDGDSLRFNLVDGIAAGSSCPSGAGPFTPVSYLSGFSATNPLQVSPGTFGFDGGTGEITFNPNALQRSMVVYNIREYRHGVFVGSSQREMNFIVVPCTNTPPSATITGGVGGVMGTDSSHYNVCENAGIFSFSINPHEPDTSNKIHVIPIGLPAGATYIITGDSTNSPHVTFSWNTTGVAPGVYTFYLKFQDNNCPVNGETVSAFTVTISAFTPNIIGNDSLCTGVISYLSSATPGGTWSSSNASVATISSTTGEVYAWNAGTSVISYVDNSTGCKTSVVVTVNPSPSAILGPTSICLGTSATLADAMPGGLWSSSNTSLSISGTGVINGNYVGVDTVFYTQNTGCNAAAIIFVNSAPTPITGVSNLCVGANAFLSETTPGGIWAVSNPDLTITPYGLITGLLPGIDTVIYNIGACKTDFIVTVNQSPAPISGPTGLCQGSNITLSDTSLSGVWSAGGSSVLTVSGTGVVSGLTAGTSTVTYTLADGCSQNKFITVYPLPVITGIDSGCTAQTTTLSASVSGGNWVSTNTLVAVISASVSNIGYITGVTSGLDTIIYTTTAGCTTSVPYNIHHTVHTSISIIDTPGSTICFGTPVTFMSNTINGGQSPQLIWLVNGVVSGSGSTYVYPPANGDNVKCIMVSDTACAIPYPDTSNIIVLSVNRNTPTLKLTTTNGDTSCVGLPKTYNIIATDTGTLPVFTWSVNLTPVAIGIHSYTYVPHNGDIITCTMSVNLPCAIPNPVSASDTAVVIDYQTPSLNLIPFGGNIVCDGNPITIDPVSLWGGYAPVYYWSVNGVPAGTGSNYTYIPRNGDSVLCIMVSNFPCVTPNDSAHKEIGIVVDPVIDVNITGSPGVLTIAGVNDTFYATVTNAGISPSYQWLVNGIIMPGATSNMFICNFLDDQDSVSCMVTTGGGTPCQGIQGFNWMIVAVARLNTGNISSNNANIKLIPNPNKGKFFISGSIDGNDAVIEVADVLGREVYKKQLSIKNGVLNDEIEMDEDFKNGIYILSLISDDGRTIIRFNLER